MGPVKIAKYHIFSPSPVPLKYFELHVFPLIGFEVLSLALGFKLLFFDHRMPVFTWNPGVLKQNGLNRWEF